MDVDEDVAGAIVVVYIVAVTLVGLVIVQTAKKRGPSAQRKLAHLCVVLGLFSIGVEILTIALAVQHGGYFVFGGEVAFWIMAGVIYKMSRSARSRSLTLASEGRMDAEAAKTYWECLREEAETPMEVLRVALGAFRQAEDDQKIISAAERILAKETSDTDAMAAFIEALARAGRLRDAENAVAKFAERNPGSEFAARTLEKVRELRTEALEGMPRRTLADLARESRPSDWKPIKLKRYAAQICRALGSIPTPTSGPPQAVGPEDLVLDDANALHYEPAAEPGTREKFTPPEGSLQSGEEVGPGSVYAAGRLICYLLTGGQTPEPTGEIRLRETIPDLSRAFEKAIAKACNDAPDKRFKDLEAFRRRIQES